MYLHLQRNLTTHVREFLLKQYGLELAHVPIEQPPSVEFGEYALPLAFELAKKLRKAPKKIAEEIAAGLGTIPELARDIEKIDVAGDRVSFIFGANQRALRDAFEQNRTWLESVGQQVSGRKITFASMQVETPAASAPAEGQRASDKKSALREQALADAGVQAMLDVFTAEIRDVEEM